MTLVEKDCGMCCGRGSHGMYSETCDSCGGTGRQTYNEEGHPEDPEPEERYGSNENYIIDRNRYR